MTEERTLVLDQHTRLANLPGPLFPAVFRVQSSTKNLYGFGVNLLDGWFIDLCLQKDSELHYMVTICPPDCPAVSMMT
jgi:hypothetical protein